MLNSLNLLPVWSILTLFWILFVGIYWLGVIFLRPFLRVLLCRQATLNDSVGYLLGAHGAYLAVLLGLLSVEAHQNLISVEEIASTEAGKVASIYRNAEFYPEPIRSQVKQQLRKYVDHVIDEAWPLQAQGIIPVSGLQIVKDFEDELLKFEPGTDGQKILHGETVRLVSEWTEARRARLQAVHIEIQDILWVSVFMGAAVATILMWVLDMRSMTHFVLGGIISFFLATLVGVIVAMDHPYTGELGVKPDSFTLLRDTLMNSSAASVEAAP
jgi:hypothetical protein